MQAASFSSTIVLPIVLACWRVSQVTYNNLTEFIADPFNSLAAQIYLEILPTGVSFGKSSLHMD